MKFFATGDWHLTDRDVDSYRWDIFPWLKKRSSKAQFAIITGDLTHEKDNHSSKLTNRLVDSLRDLAESLPLWIMMGNHDYIDPAVPFFRFLGGFKNIHFIFEPTTKDIHGHRFLFLPHARRWRKAWRGVQFRDYDYLFLHQCFDGALAASGQNLEGVPPQIFDSDRVGDALVLAGDVHVPQRVGNITYCGAPHPVVFGDEYEPRVLLVEGRKLKSIPRATLKKRVLHVKDSGELDEALEEQGLGEGDMIRIVIHLPRTEFVHWERHKANAKRTAERLGCIVAGTSVEEQRRAQLADSREGEDSVLLSQDPEKVLGEFCSLKQIPDDMLKAGLHVLKQAQGL